jgi:hypothetical protein
MSLPENRVDLRGTLFPHSHLTEIQLKKALSLFDSLDIPRPWYMEKPSFICEAEKLGMVRVLNPPETLKPAEDFKTLLSEFMTWARLHRRNGFRAFLTANPKDGRDTTWDIRGMVRQGRTDALDDEKNHSLGWHLLLHFAREIEKEEQSVKRMLKSLRENDSPLRGAVEDEVEASLFTDLPEFDSGLMIDDRHLSQVLQAWFSLFGEQLRDHEPLVTFSRRVMEYVSLSWQELIEQRLKVMEPAITVSVPDLSPYRLDELVEIRGGIFSDSTALHLKKAIVDFCRDPLNFLAELQRVSESVGLPSVEGINHGVMKLSLRHLAPGTKDRAGKGPWGALRGKTMMWIEE